MRCTRHLQIGNDDPGRVCDKRKLLVIVENFSSTIEAKG